MPLKGRENNKSIKNYMNFVDSHEKRLGQQLFVLSTLNDCNFKTISSKPVVHRNLFVTCS